MPTTRTPAAPARRSRRKPPAPTLVLMVRHGKTPTTGKVLPGRSPGLDLGEEGRAQAERAAERIATLARKPVAVYASPLERTRQTAAPIARALGLRVRIARGLVECDVGQWTGQSLARLAKTPEWQAVQHWPAGFRFPGGESFAEMANRMNDTLLGLAAAHPGQTVVAVSHADPIKAAVAGASGVPLDLFQRLVISPCSISAVLYGAGGPYVLCSNSTAALSELALS